MATAFWIQYSDGPEGEIDLSHLAGQGVFAAWNDRDYFEKVHVTEHRSIAWTIRLSCAPTPSTWNSPASPVEELMPGARSVPADA